MTIRVLFASRLGAAFLAVGVSFIPCAFAQSNLVSQARPELAPALPTITVTATRIESRADEVLADLVVIERTAIEASSARTLPELLSREAGLQTNSNGGPGQAASIITRGSSGRHTLLLIDGVRVNSLYTATAPWETIPVESIERIEVLKGPASALYGADAAGGVVQVFTRQGREGLRKQISVTAGSLGHGRVAASIEGGTKDGSRFALAAQQLAERGISATSPNASAVASPYVPYIPDQDSFRQGSVNGSLLLPLNHDWRLAASMFYSNGVSRFDEYGGSSLDSRSAVRATVARTALTGKLSPGWLTELSLGRSEDAHNPILSASYSPVDSARNEMTWQNTFPTRAGALSAGLSATLESIVTTPAPPRSSRSTRSAFMGLNGQKGVSTWQANLRRDLSSNYGERNTGFAAIGIQLTPAWRASASWGQSFVAPSFGDLYDPWVGNTSLRPEQGVNREVSLQWAESVGQAKITYFDNRLRGLIAYDGATNTINNVGAARLRGWTLSSKARVGMVNLQGSLDQLDPRDEDTGKVLARRARQQASLGADLQQGPWRWGGSVLQVGARYDDSSNSANRLLPAYATLNLFGEWRFARDFDLQIKLNNATNEHYETVYGFSQPGRTTYVTLRWHSR
jgi:vitamin B12 transporter